MKGLTFAVTTLVLVVAALVLAVAALVLAAGPAQAASVATERGDKAIVFTFDGLSSMHTGTYEGGVGMRWYVKDDLALRPGLEVSFDENELDPAGPAARERSDWSAGINLALEKHRRGPASSVSPYFGGLLGFSFNGGDSDESRPGQGGVVRNETTSNSTTIGIAAILGFEWGFTEGMTLGAEYRLGAEWTTGDLETSVTTPTDTTSEDADFSETDLGISAFSVLLSVGW